MPATSAEPTSKFQSTLPARGSDGDWITLELPQGISIHAPREGSDGAPEENYHATTKISIHAPREGERPRYAVGTSGGEDFNPRSPRGGATAVCRWQKRRGRFQSTLPARGSDRYHHQYMLLQNQVFQSTLPARGSDCQRCAALGSVIYFNPRSPRGGATPTRAICNSTV